MLRAVGDHVDYRHEHAVVPGIGELYYGIEVAAQAKVHAPTIARAYMFRKRLLDESEQFLTFKTSHWNSKLYLGGKCLKCGKKPEQVHHKKQRKDAINGFIDHIPINSLGNLEFLCKACHDEIHHGQ